MTQLTWLAPELAGSATDQVGEQPEHLRQCRGQLESDRSYSGMTSARCEREATGEPAPVNVGGSRSSFGLDGST
jgi:hypothetical protein